MTIKIFLLNLLRGVKIRDKIAISASIMKIVEKDPFLRPQLFSTNKQYVKIKLTQNETNRWSIFW